MNFFFTSTYQAISDHSNKLEAAVACAVTAFISCKLQEYGYEQCSEGVSLGLISWTVCAVGCTMKNLIWKKEWNPRSVLESIAPEELAAVTYGVVAGCSLVKIYSFFSEEEVAEGTKGLNPTSDLPKYRY